MFFHRITLFRVFGFTVRIDVSWLLLATLIVWSLATGYFPAQYPDVPAGIYWWMGIAGALGIFLSIVLHELAHSVVARQFDMPIGGITLFLFGGVAEMQDEPTSARGELLMAVAGPVTSFSIALLLWLFQGLAAGAGAPVALLGVLEWLTTINVVLALFNLVPAFPLDGGRMLRAALWQWKGDIAWATRIAARAGTWFGFALMALALFHLLQGDLFGAVWFFLIGLFVRGAATMSYAQTVTRQALGDSTVRRFMKDRPVTVGPDLAVVDLVDDYIYRHSFRMLPVMADGRLLGRVTLDDVKKLQREEWPRRTVADIMEGLDDKAIVTDSTKASEALRRMQENGLAKLLVVDAAGRLVGVLTLRDLLENLAIRLEMENMSRLAPSGS